MSQQDPGVLGLRLPSSKIQQSQVRLKGTRGQGGGQGEPWRGLNGEGGQDLSLVTPMPPFQGRAARGARALST